MKKMSMNLKKCVALTAVLGTILAALATRLHFQRKNKEQAAANTAPLDDFDDLDIQSIDNDTPRDYVSIKINAKDS